MKLKSAFGMCSAVVLTFVCLAYFTEVTAFWAVAIVFGMILPSCSTKG